jgi:hypothetical protein
MEKKGPAQDSAGDETVEHDRADEVRAELVVVITVTVECESCSYVTLLIFGSAA